MNEALLRNLSTDELLHEMMVSQDPLLMALAPQIDDLTELSNELIEQDIDLSLVVKDYKNFDMNLNNFLETEFWQRWSESNRNQLWCTGNPYDRERAKRLEEAAEDGVDGSTHGEAINDWLDCLNDRDADLEFGPLTVRRLTVEVENVFQWHKRNGTLNEHFC